MCYGYGLRENELDTATPQFVALFLQGQIKRESDLIKISWEQTRFIGSTMSKEAGKVRFPWEKKTIDKVNISPEIWDKFTPDFSGNIAPVGMVKKVLNLN